jgi:hypothetical protein
VSAFAKEKPMRPAGSLRLAVVAGTILTCGCLSNNKGQIEGTKWTSQATTVNGNELPAGGMEIEFGGDGTLRFRAGLQQSVGTYSLGMGDNVTFSFDTEVFGSKQHSEKIAISGERLTMTDPDGTSIPFVKSTASKAAEWQTLTSQAGRFSILTPATLGEQTKHVGAADGGAELHVFTGYVGATEYMVSYGDYASTKRKNDAAVLDRVRDGAIGALNGTLLSETKITIEGHPAREVTFNAVAPAGTQMTSKMRLFLVGNRLYQAWVSAPRGDLRPSSTDKFLQSLKLLKD